MTLYPNNNYLILGYLNHTQALPSFIHPNVTTRVYDFAMRYEGPLDVAEYFYGLTPNDYTYESKTVVLVRVDFQRFIAQGNIAFTSINYAAKN